MRFVGMMVAGLCMVAATVYAQNSAAPAGAPAPKSAEKSAVDVGSYGIGMNVGRSLKSDGLELNLDAFIQGIRDGMKGAEPRYTEEQLRAAFKIIQGNVQAKQEQRNQTAGEGNRREGEAFLAKNKAKPGVTALPSGLQYQIIRSGKGTSPKASDTVKVHYEGTLLDGTVFDSSIQRKEPAVFPVDGVIPGWTEALQLMKVGDRWRLFIPANLAYGNRGAGKVIGPGAVLTFDVELLQIQPPEK